MSREEALEERKLSVVKSWFSRSVSSGALHGPIHDSISDGNNSDGALASREGMEDRDSWAGLTTLRQLSMRYIFDHRFLVLFYPISYSISNTSIADVVYSVDSGCHLHCALSLMMCKISLLEYS
jgi:hypothetical protein